MMRFKAIRVRLTTWYLVMLALGLGVFGIGSWFAMRASAFQAIDEELEDRIRGVEQFMQLQISALSPAEIRDEFREHSVLGPGGDLFQVCNEEGEWLYRSAVLEYSEVPIRLPRELADKPVYEDLTVQDTPVRFATGRVVVNGKPYSIQVAASLNEFYGALDRFRLILWLSVPLLLLGAGLGGFLISRRALQPVDRITRAADSISISNLSGRLEVPESSDELQRLSETLNRMLARLEGSVQRMSQFTADASHELRAPISVIRAAAELAVQGNRTPEEVHQDMVQILAEAERTSRLIDNLLLLARADAGGSELQRELTDVSRSVGEAVAQTRALAAEKNVELTAHPGAAPAIVRGDGEALRQVAFILIDNAIKYTPEGGRVEVRQEVLHGHARITVTDSGIGIAEADLPHIFDRFWRADKARSRRVGGTGLGLSIARWIVEQHDGTIEVRSQLGVGTTVSITIATADLPL